MVRCGINFLPLALGMLVFAVVASVLMEKMGKCKPLHVVSLRTCAIRFGLLALIDENMAKCLVFQLMTGAGLGLSLSRCCRR